MYVFGLGCAVLGVRGLGLDFTHPGGTRGKWDVSVFGLRWCWGGESVGGLGQGLEWWDGVKSVFDVSLDSLC